MAATSTAREHWERAYASGDSTKGWYQPRADVSFHLIAKNSPDRSAGILDAGGGASTLADDLLAAGYSDLTVLDLSETGMQISQERLGQRSTEVSWVVADLLDWRPQRTYSVWHDRAVLHFLTGTPDQERYRETLLAATVPGSVTVIGVFGPEGPERCSGLPVRRYDVPAMAALLGEQFSIIESAIKTHTTPAETSQQFLWVTAVRQA